MVNVREIGLYDPGREGLWLALGLGLSYDGMVAIFW